MVYPGEDVWHAYHLVREGDSVTATTFRKVIRETGGADGAKESEKVKIKVQCCFVLPPQSGTQLDATHATRHGSAVEHLPLPQIMITVVTVDFDPDGVSRVCPQGLQLAHIATLALGRASTCAPLREDRLYQIPLTRVAASCCCQHTTATGRS